MVMSSMYDASKTMRKRVVSGKTVDDPKTTWIFSGFGSTRTKNVCRRDSSIELYFYSRLSYTISNG